MVSFCNKNRVQYLKGLTEARKRNPFRSFAVLWALRIKESLWVELGPAPSRCPSLRREALQPLHRHQQPASVGVAPRRVRAVRGGRRIGRWTLAAGRAGAGQQRGGPGLARVAAQPLLELVGDGLVDRRQGGAGLGLNLDGHLMLRSNVRGFELGRRRGKQAMLMIRESQWCGKPKDRGNPQSLESCF